MLTLSPLVHPLLQHLHLSTCSNKALSFPKRLKLHLKKTGTKVKTGAQKRARERPGQRQKQYKVGKRTKAKRDKGTNRSKEEGKRGTRVKQEHRRGQKKDKGKTGA